jgi:hypothetical protein
MSIYRYPVEASHALKVASLRVTAARKRLRIAVPAVR